MKDVQTSEDVDEDELDNAVRYFLQLSHLVVLIKFVYSLPRRKKTKTGYIQKNGRQARWPRYASKYLAQIPFIRRSLIFLAEQRQTVGARFKVSGRGSPLAGLRSWREDQRMVASESSSGRRVRRWRSVSEKRQIVQLTLEPGASVAEVARAHRVNANQVFKWRREFERG